MESFGGRSDDAPIAMTPVSVEVAEATHSKTAVVIYFRGASGEQLGIALELTLAESLRDELDRMIDRGRKSS